MRSRIIVGLILLLLFAVPLSAQDEAFPVYCGNLAGADCTLLEDAYAKLFQLRSGSVEFRYWSAVSGAAEGDIFSETVTGVFADLDATGVLPTYGPDLFRTIKLDAVVLTSIPEGLPAVTPDMPSRIETRVQIVDGVLYIDLDPLQEMLGPEYNGWGSYPLNLAPRDTQPQEGTVILDPLVTGLDAGELIGAFEPEFVRQFLTITRTDDGEGNAVFETFVDIKGLYAAPLFRELMRQRMESQRTALNRPSAGITDTQLDNLAQRMGELYPEPLLLYTQSVDLETGFLSGYSTWGMFDIAIMIEAAANNNDITAWGQYPIHLSITVRDFNQPHDIIAPVEVTALDYETVLRVPITGFLPLARPEEN